jgi:hypothetical protein
MGGFRPLQSFRPLPQQLQGVHTKTVRDPLDRLQCQVPLAALEAPHAGPVHPEDLTRTRRG